MSPQPAPEGPQVEPPKRRFVFAFLPALTWGLAQFPSVDLPFFFGGRLPRRPWAVGFQFTMSSGFAERYLTGLFTTRYHITGLTSFGKRDRGFAGVGGGLALRIYSPMVELEGRVGYRFGARKRGIVGAVFRLGYDFVNRELAPVPQLGFMIGACTF